MKLRFINILGKSYCHIFSPNATVREACEFLSKKINTPNSLIFLVRPRHLFYSNNEIIKTVAKENPKYIIFTRFGSSDKDLTNNIKNNTYIRAMPIPINAMKSFFNFKLIHQINSEELHIYSKYSSILKNAPDDLQERINEVAQLGYDIKDCEEALRDAYFNVQIAIHKLVSNHSDNRSNQIFYDHLSLSDDDLYETSSDLDFDDNYNFHQRYEDNHINIESLSDISLTSSEEDEEIKEANTNVQNPKKPFRVQNIPQSFKKQFHYHLTLRKMPPSKFKKNKK